MVYRLTIFSFLIGSLFLLNFNAAFAKDDDPVFINTENNKEAEFIGLPFIFSSDTMATSLGVAGVIKSAGQPQASVLGIATYSTNNSHVTYLAANSYQLPNSSQWLFSADYFAATFPEGIYFLNEESELAQAGLNGSTENDQIITHGVEKSMRLHFRYVLPWAKGENGAVASLKKNTEINSMWNPQQSGVSSINFSPFYEELDLAELNELQRSTKASGLAVEFTWDNRNSISETLKGNFSQLSVKYGQDTENIPSWLTWQFEYAHFLQLPNNSLMNNHVLAFNFAIADTPTWNQTVDGEYRRPPVFAGNSLGGFNSLRGYPSQRFHGRSSVLYTAEYRILPNWQPLADVFEGYYNVPWWQWVAYVEAGRVINDFSVSDLHQEMKLSVGLGARFEVEGVVVRTEYARSEEGGQIWVMVNQPF